MTTAFVLTGGGSLGAVQVGMLQALTRHDLHPDLLVGTSAGAMNAAWVAGHGTSSRALTELEGVWTALRRTEIFPLALRGMARGLLGRSSSLCSDAGLHRLVDRHTGISDLAHAMIPVHLVATDLLSGQDVLLSTGSVTRAVLASAAVPGVLPPVEVDGRFLVDGGIARRTGVQQALDLGADEVYVLPTGMPCALPRPPRSAVGVALQALTLLVERRLADEIAGLRSGPLIKVLPPLCPLSVSAADFSHGAELVDRGRRTALDWIAGGGLDEPEPERFLAAHRHHAAGPRAARSA